MSHNKVLLECNRTLLNASSGQASVPPYSSAAKNAKNAMKPPRQPSESMMISAPPEHPFQQSVTEFAKIERHGFLIYADRYWGWAEVANLGSTACRMVRQTGVPEKMSSEWGLSFNAFVYN